MTDLILNFLDNDIVLKICQYKLEDHFYNVCAPAESIRILPTLKYKFQLNIPEKAVLYAKNEENLTRLKRFVESVDEADLDIESNQLLDKFQDIDQIDAGEAVLFVLTILSDPSLTFTGDKRSINALAKINDPEIYEALKGRIKCLEQTIAEILINTNDDILELFNGEHWDSSIRSCSSLNKEDMLEGLKSYYNDLSKCSGELLAPFPV